MASRPNSWLWLIGHPTKPPKVENQRGEQCVVVQQKFLPKVAQTSGNQYFLGIISDPKPTKPRFDDNEIL
jgi:hypothetical protein